MSSKAEVLRLLSALSAREERSSLLGYQLAESEKKFAEEVKSREDKIGQLGVELESKANTVAYLTQQLHQSKLRLKKALEKHTYAAPTCTAAGDAVLQPGSSNAVLGTASTRPYRTSRVVRRTVSSPVPQEVASLTSVSPEAKTVRYLPTPPLPPRPPSSPQTTPPYPLIRRASTPRRRKSDRSPETSSPQNLPESGEFTTQPRPPSVSPRQPSGGSRTNLDPVRAQRYHPSPPDISDILQSQKSTVSVITKPTPPVLPPIQSDTCMHAERHCSVASSLMDVLPQSKSVDCYTSSESPDTPSSRPQHYPRRHRHIVLAKSQGLSSAPSALRVLHYGPRGVERERKETDVSSKPGAAQGTLMVKENVNEKSQAWQELHQHGAD